jgi:hypothetical protein
LALYGLDHPKIPALLADFRKPLNAKRRELSRRAVDEFGTKLTTGSNFANLVLSIGRTAAGVVSRRTGVDLFQPSRVLSYSQLKLALASAPSISSALREEIARRVEFVAVNPLDNDLDTEMRIARNQYESLVEYARRHDGLEADLERDRRAELTASAHNSGARFFFRVSGVLTFGLYKHRERRQPDLVQLLQIQRKTLSQLAFLRDVTKSGLHMDVQWDLTKVRNVLQELATARTSSADELANITFRIFAQSRDTDTREFCLTTLQRLDNDTARKKLVQIAQDLSVDMRWRVLSATYSSTPGAND